MAGNCLRRATAHAESDFRNSVDNGWTCILLVVPRRHLCPGKRHGPAGRMPPHDADFQARRDSDCLEQLTALERMLWAPGRTIRFPQVWLPLSLICSVLPKMPIRAAESCDTWRRVQSRLVRLPRRGNPSSINREHVQGVFNINCSPDQAVGRQAAHECAVGQSGADSIFPSLDAAVAVRTDPSFGSNNAQFKVRSRETNQSSPALQLQPSGMFSQGRQLAGS